MTVTVFFKAGTAGRFEYVINEILVEDGLVLFRDPDIHDEQAKIPRENIEYYVVNKDKE